MTPRHQEAVKKKLSLFEHSGPTQRIPLSIGPVQLDWVVSQTELAGRIREYFRNYLSEVSSTAEIHAESFHQPDLWADLWENPDPEFYLDGEFAFQRDFAARLEHNHRTYTLMAPELDDAFHNLLRWFLPPLLLEKNAFLIHGTGIIRDGKGYVFFGQSGAGKSTTATLISDADPEAQIIGDDAVIIQLTEKGPILYPAPLGCGYTRLAPPSATAPLKSLFALRKNSQHEIHPLSPSEGAATLLASAMSVRFEDQIEKKIELALSFARSSAKVRELRFKADAGFWFSLIANEEEWNYGKREE